jgi:uncharacterized repeat protein (TIGR01451 family)
MSVTMGAYATLWTRYCAAGWFGAALIGIAAVFSFPLTARGQDTAIMSRGDAAVTAFSGARQLGEVPSGLHPLDVTFIDVNGAVLQVFDLTTLGAAPDGQVANAPIKFQATSGEIGQVFGVALDGGTANATPNIYLASTSLFGLQIVAAGGERLVKGEPGARWMPGQFGLDRGGTPGSVWKIDGVTGVVSLFANITHDGKDNAGPGLGAIAYDSATQQLFVSDLETGLIHRLGLDGSDRGTFDHGVAARAKAGLDPVPFDPARRTNIETPAFNIEDPDSWGFAAKGRRVFAVAVQESRLYYSVAEGPQVWSVGLNEDGSFADDPRLEIDVTGTPNGNVITDIAFDGADILYLAQRGEIVGSYDYSIFAKPEASSVLRYVWSETERRWLPEAEEYAIGLKAPHRSTEGGIALNYGYDAGGNIDFNQCRMSLWTTGEHLREGEETDRVYEGGARIVHGLQGNDKSNVLPANVPPFESWFIDYDGLFVDSNVYGYVGDIAIFDPCDKRTLAESVPLPFPLPVPYYPPLPEPTPVPTEPGIYIDKECFPGLFGTEIHCEITVTNVGETLSDPIDLWDAATILEGPGAGGAVVIDAVIPDGPDWTCSPTPTPDLWCGLPPGALLPGETRGIEVVLDTGPLFAAGNFGFRNCAELEAPWFDIACDDGGTDITVTKTAPASCDPGADCTFTVTITNTGTLGFSGPVQFTDAMFLPSGAALLPPITGIVPDLGCAPPPAGLAFSCTATLTLGPGESIAFDITVTMPAAPPAYWAQNCFAMSAPGLPPPPLPLAPGVESDVTDCAWVPVGAPPPLSNLRVEKRALDGAKCYKLPGDVIGCDYEIEIINDGPSTFGGFLTFTDVIPAAATITAFPPGWICFGGPPATCGVAPAPIPAGGSITAPITVTIPLAALEGAGCVMPNTATLTAPVGTDENFFAPDDVDTAEADAFLEWVLPDGTTLVTCDPTNLKTTKEAKGDFVASGGGYRGEYVVRVTNLGPDPYKGPIKITEQLGFAPNAITFSAPWGCVGGGANYQCTHPILELAKGASVELEVKVEVPDGKHCSLKNTAVMTFPTAGTRWNKEAGDDTASATAKIPAKDCVKPERAQCEPGANEFRSESGACVCKTGYVRDEKGRCGGLVEPKLCPDGQPVPKSGRCPVPPVQCEPGPNEERDAQGQCVCKRGLERDSAGRCVEAPNPEQDCEKRGWLWNDKTKSCTPPADPGNECESRGWIWDGQRCTPPADPADQCRRKGWIWDGKTCLPPPDPAAACRKKGWVWDDNRCLNPADICRAKGWVWDGKTCLPPPDPAAACRKKGWVWDDNRCLNPADICRAKGWVWDGKQCMAPTNPAEECRKKGWTWDGTRCLSPADVCKTRGGVWDGARCQSPAELCRKKGGVWDGKKCLPATNPAEECRKKGGVWDGKKCLPATNPAEECRKKGGVWDGKKCLPATNPAEECRKKGGVWDGRKCQPKTNPAEQCRKKGGVWDGQRCLSPAEQCKARGGVWDKTTKTCRPAGREIPR